MNFLRNRKLSIKWLFGLVQCLGLFQFLEGVRFVYDTSKFKAMPLPKKCCGDSVGGLWRNKLDNGKVEWHVLKYFLLVYISIQAV